MRLRSFVTEGFSNWLSIVTGIARHYLSYRFLRSHILSFLSPWLLHLPYFFFSFPGLHFLFFGYGTFCSSGHWNAVGMISDMKCHSKSHHTHALPVIQYVKRYSISLEWCCFSALHLTIDIKKIASLVSASCAPLLLVPGLNRGELDRILGNSSFMSLSGSQEPIRSRVRKHWQQTTRWWHFEAFVWNGIPGVALKFRRASRALISLIPYLFTSQLPLIGQQLRLRKTHA